MENTNTSMNQNGKQTSGKETWTHKVGDAIEKVGDAIEKKGFKKVGDAVEKLGDKIEHLQDGGKGYNSTKKS